ncbi:MAG TPA: substrate-binding domain-containing protein [Dyella sp.]|uniref:PstS family phosphate ABC transporter substrate-binding protein n=1 Tax=Dyella sp. TaxID=1869338 RepID=UPI002F933ABB
MSIEMNSKRIHAARISSIVLFFVGIGMASAAAGTTLYGGGSNLPAGAYVGWSWVSSGTRLVPDSAQTPVATLAPSSLFGTWAGTANAVQYCQTGSGRGKQVLIGDTTSSLTPTGLCRVFGTSPSGFQIPTLASSDLPDFVVSDAPLSDTEYGTFVTNNGAIKGEPIQFPIAVGSVALIYHNSDPALPSQLNLTTAQVCRVFSGVITNWNQIDSSFLPKPITVVYRSDGSGATFNLMNHLNAVCNAFIPSGSHFIVDQLFTKGVSGLPLSSLSTTKLAADGDPVVIAAVNVNDGAIGYGGAADLLNSGGSNARYAKVDNFDPVSDVPVTYGGLPRHRRV